MNFIKSHFLDLLVGFLSGVTFFFVAEFIFQERALLLESAYDLIFLPIFGIYAILLFSINHAPAMSNKFSFLFSSLLFFSFGFFLPAFIWGFIIISAFRRGHFSI